MKNLLLAIVILGVFLSEVNAQITVTADDITGQLAIGKKITTYRDGNTTSIDLGSTGQTSWDFTSLTASDEFLTESKDVGSSPYASDFPGAQYASNYEGVFQGVQSNTWVYNTVGDNFVSHGTGTVANTQAGNTKTIITFDPAVIEYKLPVEYQSTWTYQGKQTIATTITIPIIGDQTTTIDQQRSIDFLVDAYGMVTMPDGKTLEALRIREENTLTGDNVNAFSVIYHILTKTGESVSITLADGVTANSGTVDISSISWTSGDGISQPNITVNAPTSLSAVESSGKVNLSWTDNADNEEGYYIERAEGSGQFTQIAQAGPNSTAYTDESVQAGSEYRYRVSGYKGTTTSGYSNEVTITLTTTSVKELGGLLSEYVLSQNYPNPFNPSTKIRFSIPSQEFVSLKVYDSLGKEIAVLVNQSMSAGVYSVDFNASGLSSGIYLYKLKAGIKELTNKMILLR